MSFTEVHEMSGTLEECLRELARALGHQDYEISGDRIIVRDAGRRLVIDLVYEGDRKLGALNLPMSEVRYEFIGFTADEKADFMGHLTQHMMRGGGG